MADCGLLITAGPASRTLLAEAITAVDRFVEARLEGPARRPAALRARHLIHLPVCARRHAIAPAHCPGGGAAFGAAIGGVLQTARGEKLLFSGRPRELASTVATRTGLIGVYHDDVVSSTNLGTAVSSHTTRDIMGGPRVDRLGRLPWRETTRDSDAVRYSLVYSRRCRLTTPRWDGGRVARRGPTQQSRGGRRPIPAPRRALGQTVGPRRV